MRNVVELNEVHPSIILNNYGSCIFISLDYVSQPHEYSAIEWLESNCLVNGSDVAGRINAFRKLMNCSQKPAVLISEYNFELYFPLLSAKHKECVWIQYDNLIYCRALSPKKSRLYFSNGLEYDVDFNARTIKRQMTRCSEFISLLRARRVCIYS